MTGKRDFIADIDRIPLPARHLLPISRYPGTGISRKLDYEQGMSLFLYLLSWAQNGWFQSS